VEFVDEAGAEWKGPFTEYGPRGEPTSEKYVRCSECGVEMLADAIEHATHRDRCDGIGE